MVRILWVEDEGYTDLIQYKLPMVEAGYIVDIAESAEEAFDSMELMEYDAYIIDLLLPQNEAFEDYIAFPGVEILRKMVNEYKISPEKIIVFTVVNDKRVHGDIQEIGVKKIVVKELQPINFLKEEVDKIL